MDSGAQAWGTGYDQSWSADHRQSWEPGGDTAHSSTWQYPVQADGAPDHEALWTQVDQTGGDRPSSTHLSQSLSTSGATAPMATPTVDETPGESPRDARQSIHRSRSSADECSARSNLSNNIEMSWPHADPNSDHAQDTGTGQSSAEPAPFEHVLWTVGSSVFHVETTLADDRRSVLTDTGSVSNLCGDAWAKEIGQSAMKHGENPT